MSGREYTEAMGGTTRLAALLGLRVRQAYEYRRGALRLTPLHKRLLDLYLGYTTLADVEDAVEEEAGEMEKVFTANGTKRVRKLND